MNNFILAVISSILCWVLGALAAYAYFHIPMPPVQILFAKFLGFSCLPFGLYIAYLAFLEKGVTPID